MTKEMTNTDEWRHTHTIRVTSTDGAHETWEVYLHEGGAAYTQEEWADDGHAAWTYSQREGWLCEGQPTPQGVNGEVEINACRGTSRGCSCGGPYCREADYFATSGGSDE